MEMIDITIHVRRHSNCLRNAVWHDAQVEDISMHIYETTAYKIYEPMKCNFRAPKQCLLSETTCKHSGHHDLCADDK